MFNTVNTLQMGVDAIQDSKDEKDFQAAISAFTEYLQTHHYDNEISKRFEQLAYYQKNEYSTSENSKNMLEAKNRVEKYIREEILKSSYLECGFSENEEHKILCKALKNFHEYLTCLWGRIPHKKAGTQQEIYEKIRIHNEYDVQHLMYAYLKPLFPEIREEIWENDGYESVRIDFIVNEKLVVETKCTRDSMSEKDLIDQMKADILSYQHETIMFYIYDKQCKIKNKDAFEKQYSKKIDGKSVFIFVDQPIVL